MKNVKRRKKGRLVSLLQFAKDSPILVISALFVFVGIVINNIGAVLAGLVLCVVALFQLRREFDALTEADFELEDKEKKPEKRGSLITSLKIHVVFAALLYFVLFFGQLHLPHESLQDVFWDALIAFLPGITGVTISFFYTWWKNKRGVS